MQQKPKKIRIDELLVYKGLSKNIKESQALIISGRVKINQNVITKPGTLVLDDSIIDIKEVNKYVSRGGLKLEFAIKELGINVKDKICMDIGASTGGFTDCLLSFGAKKVYCVDVGKHLLHPKLLNNPKVINIEETNFRYFPQNILKEQIEFVTIDVSFISLKKIIPQAISFLDNSGEILALVKPQFEAKYEDVKKGIVKDNLVRQEIILDIKQFISSLGLTFLGEIESVIKGQKGNKEHFLWFKKS